MGSSWTPCTLATVDGINTCRRLPVDMVVVSHYFQGFRHTRWLAGFLNHRQYVVIKSEAVIASNLPWHSKKSFREPLAYWLTTAGEDPNDSRSASSAVISWAPGWLFYKQYGIDYTTHVIWGFKKHKYKDAYLPTSIMECHKDLERWIDHERTGCIGNITSTEWTNAK